MSVRKPLEAIFAHLYDPPAEVVDVPEAPKAQSEQPTPNEDSELPLAEPPSEDTSENTPATLETESAVDEYQMRIGNITASLEHTLQETKAAALHLNTARELAIKHDLSELLQLDKLHGREHRKTGLPPGDPLHSLNAELLDSHGLLRARDLLKEVQAAAARRSAQAVGGTDILAEEASSRPPPHYMRGTKAFDTQMETKQPLTATVRSLKVLREQSRAQQLNEKYSSKLKPSETTVAAQLSMEEQQENMKILKRMQGPLNFKRNPRYVLPPRKDASDAAPSPPLVPRRDTFIHVIPDSVHFVDYEAGGTPPPSADRALHRWPRG